MPPLRNATIVVQRHGVHLPSPRRGPSVWHWVIVPSVPTISSLLSLLSALFSIYIYYFILFFFDSLTSSYSTNICLRLLIFISWWATPCAIELDGSGQLEPATARFKLPMVAMAISTSWQIIWRALSPRCVAIMNAKKRNHSMAPSEWKVWRETQVPPKRRGASPFLVAFHTAAILNLQFAMNRAIRTDVPFSK